MDSFLKKTQTLARDSLLAQRLQQLVQGRNYQIIQNNGQRIFGPNSTIKLIPPQKGSEIFIGNLPHDLYEDELLPIFETVGPIYKMRIMLDFFGRNRGYAFISYFNPGDAYTAIEQFNGWKIRNRTKLAVSISVDNRRLFIGNIPRQRTLNEIREVLERYSEGITDVIMYYEPYVPDINRGFVFVEFETHRQAAIARRQLSPGNLVIWGQPIYVDWAEPLPILKPDVLKTLTKLYLSNVPNDLSTEELKFIIFSILKQETISKVHKMSTYAFVHFKTQSMAEHALGKLKGLRICENLIGVEWARPIEFSKRYRSNAVPENYCRSVPPNIRKLVHQSIALRNSERIKQYTFNKFKSPTISRSSESEDFVSNEILNGNR